MWNKKKSFNKSNLTILWYKEPVILSVDASQHGLGAVLLQDSLLAAYGSKASNETQRRYARIETETVAIAFGCTKLHQYIDRKNVMVESDHKPLEMIFKKPLSQCPARLQRIRL